MPMNIKNESSLIQACASGNDKLVAEALKTARDQVNVPASNGSLPLMFAAEAGSLASVQLLIANGALVEAMNQGKSVLHFASQAWHFGIVYYLLQTYPIFIQTKQAEILDCMNHFAPSHTWFSHLPLPQVRVLVHSCFKVL